MSLSDKFQVEIWKGDWELPSVDVDCLKVLTYAKFNNISLCVRATDHPFKTPTAHLPVLKFKSNTICTVDEILDIFCKNNKTEDILSPVQHAEAIAYHSFIEECLNPAVQYLWWIDEQNLNKVIRPWYCDAIPFPFNFYYPGKYEKEAKFYFEVLYPTEELPDVERIVFTKAKNCINVLSDKLGESDYFFGSIPTKFDALAFAYLAPLLKIPFLNCSLQNHLKTCSNLLNFITRILDLNFKKEQESQKQKKKEKVKKPNSDSEYKDAKKHQIIAGMIATIAMVTFALSTGIMRVQERDYKTSEEYYGYENDVNYIE